MSIKIKIAWGDTLWWSNIRPRKDRGSRWRHDTIVGITRAYARAYGVYVYRFTVGKFTVGISFQRNLK